MAQMPFRHVSIAAVAYLCIGGATIEGQVLSYVAYDIGSRCSSHYSQYVPNGYYRDSSDDCSYSLYQASLPYYSAYSDNACQILSTTPPAIQVPDCYPRVPAYGGSGIQPTREARDEVVSVVQGNDGKLYRAWRYGRMDVYDGERWSELPAHVRP